MISISVPSSAHFISKGDYSFDSTDFENCKITKPQPLPSSGIAYEGGTNNDVIFFFENEDTMRDYLFKLGDEKVALPQEESDRIKNQKIDRIVNSISLYFNWQSMKERFYNKTFALNNSNITYKFQHGNTLTIAGYQVNKMKYDIALRNDKLYLDTNKQIESEELEIIIGTDDVIQLEPEFTHRITLRLQEV